MYAIVSHKVQDYAVWRPFYDADEPRRASRGIKTLKVFREQTDPHAVYFYWEVNDPAEVSKMTDDPELQELMKTAGVISKPEVHFLEEV